MIDRAQVDHVAALARLDLTDAEKARLERQLAQILEAFAALNTLQVDHVPPTAQVIPLETVERDDMPTPCLPLADVLRNAPRTQDDQIRVPPVLDER